MIKVGIIYNKYKKNAVKFYEKLLNHLKEKDIEVLEKKDYSKAKVLIVIGGDGTLLNASKKLEDLSIPVLAVNMGSLGFLTDVREEEAFEMFEIFLKGDCIFEERAFLEVRVNDKKNYVLNDAVLKRGGILARMLRINLYANDIFVNTYRADGVIIATPTGSTAYSLSAGGPIVKPDLNAIIITPIAPHTLTARPIILSGNEEIRIEILEEDNDVHLMLDGQDSIKVEMKDEIRLSLSTKKLKLIKPKNRGYYSILREKLKWGDKLC